jgi:hypothetical protein
VNPVSTIVYALVGAAALVLIPNLLSATPERAD